MTFFRVHFATEHLFFKVTLMPYLFYWIQTYQRLLETSINK